jgi:hypothetical protein
VMTSGASASTTPSTLTLRGGGASVPEVEANPVRFAAGQSARSTTIPNTVL